MLTNVLRVKFFADVALFVGTTIGLSVLAEQEQWAWFAAVAVLCALLYTLLRISETKPALTYLENRTQREHHFANTLAEYGITNVFNMQNDAEAAERNRLTADLIERGHDFALSGSSGASYLDPKVHRHWPHVRKKLSSGHRFRLLLTDPFSEAKKIRNTLNGVASELDPKLDLDNLARLLVVFPSLQVRFTDQVYCSVFFTEHDMVYDPYHLGQVFDRLENRFFALQLDERVDTTGASYFQQLKNHFEFLWSEGQGWAEFVAEHPHLVVDQRAPVSDE